MVSPAVAPSAGLDTLLARPPTPPRERQSDLDPKLNLNRHAVTSRLILQTPPSHSPDPALSTNANSRRSGKRVEFTVHAEYCDPPTETYKKNEPIQSTPISAPSSVSLSKPLKSILKPTPSPNPSNPLDPSASQDGAGSTITLVAMLESTIKHLASNDRDAKVDAYTMLVRALKTSTNLPDRIALQSKMSLFMQFIQRDITTKGGNGAVDSSLVNHALALLSTFLHFPAIATTVTPDFAIFIIDHCIRSFEDPVIPKDVVRHLMQVVVYQDFPSKVMTADRVGRLVTSLHNIEQNIKGKSIIMSRILIYRRLIKQSTIHMVSRSEWLLDLLTDMLSSLKEIRSTAIALGLEASFTVAKEKQFPKKVMEILQMTAEETSYAEYYVQRLTAMTKEKSEMAAVPQIWSVVILLLRCPIDRWEFFDRWLEIIQRCFNSGDYQTKLEANYAWNRLVYALYLHESSFSKAIGTLCQPFNQLRRRGKQPDELRKVVIGGLCNLYYYAFKPNSSPAHVDHYWDACVRTVIRTLAFPETEGKPADMQQTPPLDNLSQAANILTGLFDSSSVRLWKEDRIAENTLARPSELPPLDPKWIRRNAPRVFLVVEPIIVKSFMELAEPESSASKLWRSLIGAVASAASKEVKVSIDTAAFLGNALSLFTRIWAAGLKEATPSADMQRSFLKATETYLTTMVLSIGHLPFTEKLLSMNKQNTLVPVATPSHRSGKAHGPIRSALHHLFSILSLLPRGISDSEDVSNLFRVVFEPFMLTRSTRGRRDVAQELMQIQPPDGPVSYGPWVFIAEALATPGDSSQSSYLSTDSTSQSPIGHDFRDIVKHLEKGISHTSNLPWPQWLSLFRFVVGQATELSGEAGCSVAVIEPLAKAVFESFTHETNTKSPNIYKCGVQLMSNAKQPRDRQALDAARRRLWGTTVAGIRSASFDPFDHLYRLTSRLLELSYTAVDSIDDEILFSLITETSNFLSRSYQVLVFKSLVQLQQGLGPWIQDTDERYGSRQRSTVAQAVKLLWDRICNLFLETTLENFQLDTIEQLLCCAFKSKHRHIVNSAVSLWNRSFENASEIQYPVTLRDVLLSLRPYVDIALPGLDISTCDTNNSLPLFVDSQDDLDVMTSSGKLGQMRDSALNLPASSGHLETPRSKQTLQSGFNKAQDLQGSSHSRSTRSTRSTKRNGTPKLRHDDSQIQFATIEESSPSNRALESQILTDRQKEVRQRQLENAVLLPTIRSSPEKDKEIPPPSCRPASAQQSSIIQSPTTDRSATPKATRSFDYVSSTPTPRRGQQSMIDEDHDMIDDVPSSPPEPRRNLLPEMKSHSRDTRMLDDMPITSSPISGSPVSRVDTQPPSEHLESQGGAINTGVESVTNQQDSSSTHGSIVAVTRRFLSDPNQEVGQNRSIASPMIQRLEALANFGPSKAEKTPSSDNEVFVDAITSPLAQRLASRGAGIVLPNPNEEVECKFQDRSFEMSDGEERSMARLVIELDSRKCEPLPDYDTASPEKAHRDRNTMECITVQTGLERQNSPSISQSGELPPVMMLADTETDDSQSAGKKSKKRKRVPDKRQNTSGKRHRRGMRIDGNDADTIMHSQVPLVHHEQLASVSDTSLIDGGEIVEEEKLSDEVSPTCLQGSPDLSYNPNDQSSLEPLELDEDGMDSDTAAVNLQLITEASQQSEVDNYEHFTSDDTTPSPDLSEDEIIDDNEGMEEFNTLESKPPDNTENIITPRVGQSAVERIAASLRDSLEGLRTATLSREDVYKIEDMFMDIKKELYEAERRSR
ncbi:Rap1-interacting factor 1 N terminal-domain-containing protein [Hypoxylon argillaceum]|nr:Rap1-interacting factor 1 N terminal-domain-containing protein [Hypoxylon argillaceum]